MPNKMFLLLIALFIGISFSVAIAIQVSGDVWGVWNPANNPYEVIGDLHVPRDSSLNIMPGCSIQFQGYYKMTTDSLAKLTAVGTAQDSIFFFPTDTATGWAGIRLYDADTTSRFSYCSFIYRNYTVGDTASGAIYFRRGAVTIDHSNFYRNRGGVIWTESYPPYHLYTTRVKITSCTFKENNPEGTAEGWGGVVYMDEGDATISNSIFQYNKGGVIICWGKSIISNNIITDNLGTAVGQYWGDTFKVEHNVICNNQSTYLPSGIMAQEVGGPIIITNNTIGNNVNNNNYDLGVFVFWNEHGFSVTFNMKNNIFWGDSSVPLTNYDNMQFSYTDFLGGCIGEGNINADPMFVDSANGDYRLRWDSPCIDAGDPASPRDPDGSRADMGALPPYVPPFTIYLPGDINGDDNLGGADVTYGVRYLKGIGEPPPIRIFNDSAHSWLYAAADVNGNCEFGGSDITYLVAYFKSINPRLRWCPQTLPFIE
jgi:hypothetical protein